MIFRKRKFCRGVGYGFSNKPAWHRHVVTTALIVVWALALLICAVAALTTRGHR